MKILLIMMVLVFSFNGFEENPVSIVGTVPDSTDQIPLLGHSVTPHILIVEPDLRIDYKILIVKPDPRIDYKILKIKRDSPVDNKIDIIAPKR